MAEVTGVVYSNGIGNEPIVGANVIFHDTTDVTVDIRSDDMDKLIREMKKMIDPDQRHLDTPLMVEADISIDEDQ